MMRYLPLVVLACCFLIGCSKDDQPPVDLRLDYYPLELGQERVYRMDSLIFDRVAGELQEINSTSYRRERIIDSTWMDREEIEYRIEISYKAEIDDEWQVRSFDRVSRFNTELKRTYGNQQFVLLTFPPEQGAQWDGLAFIDKTQETIVGGERINIWQDWDDFAVLEDSKSAEYDDVVYDDVIRVEEANFDDEVLLLRESFSDYAAAVGVVFRSQRIYELTCSGAGTNDPCRDTSVPWEEDAERGYSFMQTLITQ